MKEKVEIIEKPDGSAEAIKKQLEQHYRRELDLIYEVLQLSDDEIHELLGWFATNPVYQGLKEVVDGIRERGRREKETCRSSEEEYRWLEY